MYGLCMRIYIDQNISLESIMLTWRIKATQAFSSELDRPDTIIDHFGAAKLDIPSCKIKQWEREVRRRSENSIREEGKDLIRS